MPDSLAWDAAVDRKYIYGIDHGVLYLRNSAGTGYDSGIPWNGLTQIQLNPTGGEPNKIRADNLVYCTLYSPEEMGGTITAYNAPDEFNACDGRLAVTGTDTWVAGQERKPCAIGFRAKTGNAASGDAGYEVVYLYGCYVSPSDRTYETIGETPTPQQLSWSFTSIGEVISGIKNPVSMMIVRGANVDVQQTLPMPTPVT